MKKNALIVDSTISVEESYFSRYDCIRVVPHSIIVTEDVILDTVEDSRRKYSEITLSLGSTRPKTSQPNPMQFVQEIKNLMQCNYDEIIILSLTTKTSGTYQSAQSAIQMMVEDGFVESGRVRLIDSKQVALGQILLAQIFISPTRPRIDEIEMEILSTREHLRSFYLIRDISGLLAGGRINNRFFISDLIGMWHLVEIVDGALSVVDRTRTYRQGIHEILEIYNTSSKSDAVVAINDVGLLEKSKDLADLLRKSKTPPKFIHTNSLSLALSVHFGPQAIGISWIE